MSRDVTRRELLAAGGGLALATVGGGFAQAQQTFNWKKYDGTTLRVLTLKFPLSELQEKRLGDFQQLTGIKVNWEALPEDLLRQKVKVEHLGGGTDLDVFLSYWAQDGQQFMTSGWYVDTLPMIGNAQMTNADFNWDDFIPAVRAGATIGGKVPIVPDRAQALPILYYRRDLFAQFKLDRPKTWDDVRNAAKVIFEGTNKQVFGIVLRGKGAAATSMFGPVLYDFGGRWADRTTGDLMFNTPEALKAFEWWGSILRDYGPPGSVNNHFAEVTSIFSQGRAAMVYDDITFTTLFSDPTKSTVAGKFGTSVAPTGPASANWRSESPIAPTSTGLAISSLSKKKEAAWMLVQFLSDKTQSQRYMLQGGLGARASAWADPEVIKALDPEFLETGRASTLIAAPGAAPHSITNVAKARDFIGEAIVTSIQGGNVKAALDTAFKNCSELLKEERAKR